MSSILRALKKLENDPRHLQDTPPLDTKFVPLADTRPQKSPANMLVIIIGGGIVCGLVILAGWWLLSVKTQAPPLEPQKISRQNLPQAEIVPVTPEEKEPVQRLSAPPASLKTAAEETAPSKAAVDTVAPPEAAAQLPAATSLKSAEPPPPALVHKDVLPADEQAAEAFIQKQEIPPPRTQLQLPPENVATPVTRPPEPPRASREIEIPLLNDPDMKLQAITWSKDPQKRLAVLNNHILRQGENVNGYRIDTINQDDVLLSRGGEKWKLVFRIK